METSGTCGDGSRPLQGSCSLREQIDNHFRCTKARTSATRMTKYQAISSLSRWILSGLSLDAGQVEG